MIKSASIDTTETVLLEVPTSKTYATTVIFFCNNSDTVDEYINVYFVASGSLPDATNKTIANLVIEKQDTFVLDVEKIILSSGDEIVATSMNGGMVSATVSYIEI